MSAPFAPRAVTLGGDHVRLEPLGPEHAEDLLAAGRDPDVWRYMPRPAFSSLADARSWIDAARAELAAGRALAFASVEQATGRAAGSTRLFDFRPADRGVEIGWTWLGKDAQRTGINTESKLLLLTHAFEILGALRVQFKTDARNLRSQAALERVGAVREGVLRNHVVMPDGHLRASVFYSILPDEWPDVRDRLTELLARGRPAR